MMAGVVHQRPCGQRAAFGGCPLPAAGSEPAMPHDPARSRAPRGPSGPSPPVQARPDRRTARPPSMRGRFRASPITAEAAAVYARPRSAASLCRVASSDLGPDVLQALDRASTAESPTSQLLNP